MVEREAPGAKDERPLGLVGVGHNTGPAWKSLDQHQDLNHCYFSENGQALEMSDCRWMRMSAPRGQATHIV